MSSKFKIATLFIVAISACMLSFTVLDQRGQDKDKKKKKKKGKEQVDPMAEYRQEVAQYRLDCKKALKPYRYSFGRTTFFNYRSYNTSKELEVSLLLDASYKFCFNAQGVKEKAIGVRVYNKSKDYKSRELLYEKKGVSGNSFSFTSNELLTALKERYRAKGYDEERVNKAILSKIFIDYIIPAIEDDYIDDDYTGRKTVVVKKGAIVFASGYENLEAND